MDIWPVLSLILSWISFVALLGCFPLLMVMIYQWGKVDGAMEAYFKRLKEHRENQ